MMMNKQEKKIHHTTVHRVQAIRLFHLIQQNVNQPRNILSASLITEFFHRINNNTSNNIIQFIHKIDKHGREMNEDYWGSSISQLLQQVEVCNDADINNIHYSLKSLLQGHSWKPLHQYENWDKLRNQTQQQKQSHYQLILKTCSDVGPYLNKNMDLGNLQLLISQLNCCLSLITLDPSKEEEIIQIYQQFAINLISVLEYALTLNIEENKLLDEFLKMLCYFYSSLKYKDIKLHLQRTFLMKIETKWGLMRNIQDKRPDVRYFTSVLAALISHYDKDFTKHILTNSQYLGYMCKNIGYLSEQDGILYAIEFLTNIIKCFCEAESEWKTSNRDIVVHIFNFSLSVLQMNNTKFQTLASCLRLIAQCVRAIDFSSTELKCLKVVSNVFQNNHNSPLIAATLSIYRNAFLKPHKNTQESLLGQKQFDTYFKQCLTPNHSSYDMHFTVLQIMLLLSYPENIKHLFQKNLIQHILELRNFANGTTIFFLSEIVYNLILNSLDTEWMLTYLYEKKILDSIGLLFSSTLTEDITLFNHYPIQSNLYFLQERNLYFQKHVFIYCLKSLYFLTAEIDNAKYYAGDEKKRELYKKNFTSSFLNNFEMALTNYLRLPTNFLKYSLREEQTLVISDVTRYLKTFKLISFVIEEMTVHLRNYFIELNVLKKINMLRNDFLFKIYGHLSMNELLAERIPIYVRLNVKIQGCQPMIKKVPRLNWQEFNSCLNEIVFKRKQFDAVYQIKQNYTKRTISTEGDYRNILDHILHNFEATNYNIYLDLYDLKRVQPRQFNHPSSSVRMNQMELSRSRVDIPRFMSTKMPVNRDMSPFSSRKGMAHSQRSSSPNFGFLCTQCRRNSTTNASKICSQCAHTDFK